MSAKVSKILIVLAVAGALCVLLVNLAIRMEKAFEQEELSKVQINKEFEVQGMEGIGYSYYYEDGIYCRDFDKDRDQEIMNAAKGMGVNFLYVRASYNGNAEGTITGNEEDLEKGIKRFIEIAHKNGIGIFLVPYLESGNYVGAMEPRWHLNAELWDPIVLKWAEFAEENGVEIYAPGVEMSIIFDEDRIGNWYQEILPQIREVYGGEVAMDEHFDIERWKLLDEQGAYEGYDYLGMTVFPRKTYEGESDIRSMEDYLDYVEFEAKTMKELAEKYGIEKLMAAPIGMDYFKGENTMKGGEIDPTIRTEGYSAALDIFDEYGFDAVFLHANPIDENGEENPEMSEMVRSRWTVQSN